MSFKDLFSRGILKRLVKKGLFLPCSWWPTR